MSTTFVIIVPDQDEPIEIAFRSNGIIFTNPLAQLLPDKTFVIPVDNSAQGIYTIGDIKNQIIKQNLKNIEDEKNYKRK